MKPTLPAMGFALRADAPLTLLLCPPVLLHSPAVQCNHTGAGAAAAAALTAAAA